MSLIKDLLAPPEEKKVFSSETLSNSTIRKLLPYQVPHAVKLIKDIVKNFIAIDGSDAGIGKTYIALAVAIELGRIPFIICPISVLSYWVNILDFFNLDSYAVVNLETFKNGKIYDDYEFKISSRKTTNYLRFVDMNPDVDPTFFRWNLPDDAILIIDEAHRCKETNTDNGKLLMSTKQLIKKKIPVLLLSATICEKYTDMKILFYLFNYIDNVRNFNAYIKSINNKYPQHIVRKLRGESQENLTKRRENARSLIIYEETKEYMSRIRIKELGDKFPSNQWCAQLFTAASAEEIAKSYIQLAEHMRALKEDAENKHHLAQCTILKMEIEYKKIPIFVEQAQLFLDEGKSVIIFVNYTKTLEEISSRLDIRCKVYGDQTKEERVQAIKLFQENKERIIICNMRAGSESISLHDLDGNYPRVGLHNFADKAATMIQALGRAVRSGGKSAVIQRILCVANVPYEQTVMKNINKKLIHISAINDGDLDGYKYKIKTITRIN